MGTIFNQPEKDPRVSLEDGADDLLRAVEHLVKSRKVTRAEAFEAMRIAQSERWIRLAYSVYNTLDEDIAWAAKLWCRKNRVEEDE